MFTFLNQTPKHENIYDYASGSVDVVDGANPPLYVFIVFIIRFGTRQILKSCKNVTFLKIFKNLIRYRSIYSCHVKKEAACKKTGCFRTMGIPHVCLCPPQNFLKKHSKAPISIKCTGKSRCKIERADILNWAFQYYI